MAQLVGLPCAICDEHIGTALDGEFCGACGCPVHVRCARQEARPGTCAACGAADALGEAHRRRAQEASAATQSSMRGYHTTWGILRLCAGIVCLVAGLVLLLAVIIWPAGVALIVAGTAGIARAGADFRAARRLPDDPA